MDREPINRVLRIIGAEEIRQAEKWVNCRCPLAPWTHSSGSDSRPSFGVSVDPDGTSVYFCFGCMENAKPLFGLPHQLFVLSGGYPFEASAVIVREEVWSGLGNAPYTDVWDAWTPSVPPSYLPKWAVDPFPLLQMAKDPVARQLKEWMFTDRGIHPLIQNMFRLRVDVENKAVVFPMMSVDGRISVMRKRRLLSKNIWTVSPKEFGRYDVEFPKLRHNGVWFGLSLVDWSKPVMMVEGEFDAMRIATLGFRNVIASATSSLSKAQVAVLSAGDNFILGYDADKSGKKTNRRLRRSLQDCTVREVDWTEVKCEDGGDLRSRKDLRTVLRACK